MSEAQAAAIVVCSRARRHWLPAEDLLLRPGFVRAGRPSTRSRARAPTRSRCWWARAFDRHRERHLRLAEERRGRLPRKHFLPNYGVFDEHRYFAAGRSAPARAGRHARRPTICGRTSGGRGHPQPTSRSQVPREPLHRRSSSARRRDHEEMLVTRARELVVLAFCNLVGGQDELVFDGHVVVDDEGEVARRPVRGGAADGRRRSDRGGRPSAPRRTPARARAVPLPPT